MNFVYEVHELRQRLSIIEKAKRGEITEEEALKQINERADRWANGEKVIL